MSNTDDKEIGTGSKGELAIEIGRSFAKRREARGISPVKASQATKIRMPLIEAIESGEWDQLPGGVYTKGILTTYAHFLGFDANEILSPFLKSFKSGPSATASDKAVEDSVQRGSRAVWILLGVAAVVLMMFVKLIFQESHGAKKMDSGLEKTGATVTPIMPDPTPVLQKNVVNLHELKVYSPSPLWIRVEAADKNFEGFIPQASTWSWKGSGSLNVRVGHTMNVSLYVDGKLFPLQENQKRILIPDAY